jgi:hypothetical protein
MGLRFRARFWIKLAFGGFLIPLNSVWESSTPFNETSSLRKIAGSLSKTLLEILLFETLSGYHFEQAIPRLLVGMAHFANVEQE